MDKEVVVHLYKGILINHKKERIWVSWAEVDERTACYTEWSKSKRENQILYINAYIWNLEKWHWWTYFEGRKRDTENSFVDTMGGGEGKLTWETSIETQYITICKLLTDS